MKDDGFNLDLTFNPRKVSPKIEFYEITDAGLKRFWPEGITRIVFEIQKSVLKGDHEFVLSEIKE